MTFNAVKADNSHLPSWLTDTSGLEDTFEVSPEVQKRIDDMLGDADEVEATYKIEVVLAERSGMNSIPGMIVVFTNGGFAHGGGDEGVYFCVDPVERDGETRTCSTPLKPEFVRSSHAICPGCRRVIDIENLQGQMFARLTLQNWAHAVEAYFRKLGGDADIRMVCLAPKDQSLIKNTHLEMARDRRGDELRKTYAAESSAIYPLRNILKDTAAGAELYKRIRAFLAS